MGSARAMPEMPAAAPRAGVPAAVLDLHLGDMRQLFNAMDPAPFRERALDPAAETYIVDWAEEAEAGAPLALVVYLSREPVRGDMSTPLSDAVHAFFRQRAASVRRALKRLFRDGRISLAIGVTFLAAAIGLGELLAGFVSKASYASLVKESFVIGGWVALWRPMEIFFYDWWPLAREARLCDRLGAMDVRVLEAAPAAVLP